MNRIDAENDAALAEVYENDLAVNGVQSEGVKIDGREVCGILEFDPTTVELVMDSTNENVTAVFFTRKSYWPDGNYPKPLSSEAFCFVNGTVRLYQVRQLPVPSC